VAITVDVERSRGYLLPPVPTLDDRDDMADRFHVTRR